MNKPLVNIDVLAKRLIVDNTLFTKDRKSTFLSADVSSASGTLTVDSIVGFSTSQILLIGEFGNEDSEIIKMSSATGSTITLASNTTFAHTQGVKVYLLDWDQVEFSRNATATAAGSLTLTTIDIQADSLETVFRDTTNTTGYGYVRFKETVGNTFSIYSDVVPYTGWTDNQVGSLIEYALKRNKIDFNGSIDHDFCIDEINSCLQYIHGKRKKWSRLQEFDYILGQTEDSEWAFDTPSDMWGYSNKSILDIHLEEYGSLVYQDEREWNELMEDVRYSTLSAAASATDTSIYLTNSFGFGTSGTVLISGDSIDYTANDTATGKLTCTALANDLTDESMVWGGDYQNGKPLYYTIKEEKVYVYPSVSTTYKDINLMVDYWKEAPDVNSDADTLDVSRYDMVKNYLTAVIRWQKSNDGKVDLSDGDYLLFEKKLDDCIRIEMNTTGQKFKLRPVVNKIRF